MASPGTEGFNDFLGQLSGSGLAFTVVVVAAQVQGRRAGALARGIKALAEADCDLVVLVRGGGSKADLVAFDSEPVARAIALCPVPVWTGIGHTGDQSVADIVAGPPSSHPPNAVRNWCSGPRTGGNRSPYGGLGGPAGDPGPRGGGRSGTTTPGPGWDRPPDTSCTDTPSASTPVPAHRRPGAASSSMPPLGRPERPTDRTLAHRALAHQDERLASWRRLLAAYDVEAANSAGLHADVGRRRTHRPIGGGGWRPVPILVTRLADGRRDRRCATGGCQYGADEPADRLPSQEEEHVHDHGRGR